MGTAKKLNVEHRAMLRKAEALADFRGRVDVRAMAAAFGLSIKSIEKRARELRPHGWKWKFTNYPNQARRAGRTPDALDPGDRAILAAAAKLAGEGDWLAYGDLAAEMGMPHRRLSTRITSISHRGLWPYRAILPGTAPADPAVLAAERAKAHAGMGDGRAQVDDPIMHAALAPRSGIDHRTPAESDAKACRRYLREWRMVRRGRAGASREGSPMSYEAAVGSGASRSSAGRTSGRSYRSGPAQVSMRKAAY